MKIKEMIELIKTEEGTKVFNEIVKKESEKELKRTKELKENERERTNDECRK